jgi:tetratricopeptide (TPR) repeat protein
MNRHQTKLPTYHWYFLLLLVLCFFQCPPGNAQANNYKDLLKDSIQHQLLSAGKDTAQLRAVLTKIRKRRRKLGDHYEALMLNFIQQSEKANYRYGLMKSYDFMGLQLRYNESYETAIDYHHKSLAIAKDLKDTLQMCYNYNNLGQAYRKQDLNAQALPYFHQALLMQEKIGHEKSASFTHNTLGATYLSQNEFDKALFHMEASNAIAIKRNDIRTMAFNYGMIGEIHLLKEEADEALPYFEEALSIKKELNYDKGIAVTLHLMAQAYYQKQDFAKASQIFWEAIDIHQRYKNKRYLALCYAYLGKIHTEQNQYNKAEQSLLKALKMAEEVHSLEQLVLINEALTNLYRRNNNWKKAYTYLNYSNSWKDSLNTAKYQKQIQSLEVDYQTQKKEQQIEILSSTNRIKSQRIRLGIAVIVILILILVLVFYMLSVRKKNAIQQEEKLRQQLLKSQMNPHFIFNSLGSIQNYMYRNEPDKAARYMGNFAKLTRSILNNSSSEKVSLDEEIETLTNYLELEQMRMKGAFDYQIKFDEDLETELINIPPLLLQPFLENSIKHGVKDMRDGAIIRLSFEEHNDFICAEIEDNGVGINNANKQNKSHKSLATEIFKQRIAILKNQYPALPEPLVKDLSDEDRNGTLVKVYLPIID